MLPCMPIYVRDLEEPFGVQDAEIASKFSEDASSSSQTEKEWNAVETVIVTSNIAVSSSFSNVDVPDNQRDEPSAKNVVVEGST